MPELHCCVCNLFLLVIPLNINMLASSICLRVLRKCNSAIIVTMNNDRVYRGVCRGVSSIFNGTWDVKFLQ